MHRLAAWVVALASRRLAALTAILAAAHAAMSALHLIGRAAPAITPARGLAGALGLVDDWWWVGVHALIAVALVAAVGVRSWRLGVTACAFSAVTWLLWMGLLLVWSLDTIPPVSLTAPVLGLIVLLPLSVVIGAAWSEDGIQP